MAITFVDAAANRWSTASSDGQGGFQQAGPFPELADTDDLLIVAVASRFASTDPQVPAGYTELDDMTTAVSKTDTTDFMTEASCRDGCKCN